MVENSLAASAWKGYRLPELIPLHVLVAASSSRKLRHTSDDGLLDLLIQASAIVGCFLPHEFEMRGAKDALRRIVGELRRRQERCRRIAEKNGAAIKRARDEIEQNCVAATPQ